MILKSQQGRGTKIHILLDDEYAVTTDVDSWAEFFVPDGTDVSEEEWQELLEKINYRKAYNKCADLLSRREHSVSELRFKLLRTVDENSANKAIEKFTEMGYLDDERYAKNYARHLAARKNYSLPHIRQELYSKGLSKDVIDATLNDLEVDDNESIKAIVRKNYLAKLGEDGGKQKVVTALLRRGFSYDDIKHALNEIENE